MGDESNEARRDATQQAKSGLTVSERIGLVAIIGSVAFIGLIVYFAAFPSTEKKRHEGVMQALAQCQSAIKSVAKYGNAETPPYIDNYGRGDEFYFVWPSGSFHFANEFGAQEKMSASCIGVISTGLITQLTINGKDFR